MSDKFSYALFISFLAGVVVRFSVGDALVVSLFVVCFLCAWSVCWICTKNDMYRYAVFCGIVFLVGIVRTDTTLLQDSQFKHLEKTYVTFEGLVTQEPRHTDKGMRMQVEVLKVGSSTPSRRETVLLGYEGYDTFLYGDKIKFGGALELPESFETEAGRTFNYPKYLRKDGIFFLMQKAKIERLESGAENGTLSLLYSMKRSLISKMGGVLNAGDTALMSGILLGAQDSIPKTTKEDFQKAGLTHILVLSGYNITVVGEAVSRMANVWFSKFVSLGFGAVAIILFAFLSGGGASTVRSVIMALIAILGKILGREYDAFRALILVGCVMVAWNPYTLLYDPSFHLSFLATAGMILLSKRIELKLSWVRYATLREILATTLAVQVFVTPYFLWSTGSVSVISLVSNILVLPTVPATMLFGFITAVLGFVSTWLAFVPGFISHLLLLYITSMAHFFASVPWAVWSVK